MGIEKRKEKILKWLRKNRNVLVITEIGRSIEAKQLKNVVAGLIDSHGTPYKIADKHVEGLEKTIKEICKF